jgi:hypothetical protein
MIDDLPNRIVTFPGDENRAQCFNHVVALIAKGLIRQFDVPKGKADAALDEAERELNELAEGIGIEDEKMRAEWEGNDEDNEDNNGWVDEVACLLVADREELEANITPMRLVLVKVSIHLPSWQSWIELTLS